MQTQLLARVTAAAVVAAGVGAATVPAHAGTTTTAVTTAAQASTTRVVAAPGQRGAVVHAMQFHLFELGYLKASPTGYYGPLTRRAVSAFQHAHHLRVTGVDDAATDTALNRAYDADPHRGWISSVRRTRTGWALTVVKDRMCINGDTSRTCRGVPLSPEGYNDVPIGTTVLPVSPKARIQVLAAGDNVALPPMSFSEAVRRKVVPGQQMLVDWTWDGHGRIATLAQEYRP